MTLIPVFLYRGDGDRDNVRNLKKTLNHNQLQTNLLNGGNGHEVFSTPLIDLIAQHVDPGWAKTHFLSFSENMNTAKKFGLHCDLNDIENLMENYTEIYDDDKTWDFALIEIETDKINWKKLDDGIYEGTHAPTLKKFQQFPGHCSMILINVVQAIKKYNNLTISKQVIENASRDKEWLLLPTTKIALNMGKIENSGIFDGHIISRITKYKNNSL